MLSAASITSIERGEVGEEEAARFFEKAIVRLTSVFWSFSPRFMISIAARSRTSGKRNASPNKMWMKRT